MNIFDYGEGFNVQMEIIEMKGEWILGIQENDLDNGNFENACMINYNSSGEEYLTTLKNDAEYAHYIVRGCFWKGLYADKDNYFYHGTTTLVNVYKNLYDLKFSDDIIKRQEKTYPLIYEQVLSATSLPRSVACIITSCIVLGKIPHEFKNIFSKYN